MSFISYIFTIPICVSIEIPPAFSSAHCEKLCHPAGDSNSTEESPEESAACRVARAVAEMPRRASAWSDFREVLSGTPGERGNMGGTDDMISGY